MEYSITIYFALFIIYAVAGWIMEVITKLIFERKLGDRGFLIGHYCPCLLYTSIGIEYLGFSLIERIFRDW